MARGMSPPRTDSSSPRERDRFANNSYSLVPKLKECDGRGTQRTSDLSVYKTRKSERCTDWKAPLQPSLFLSRDDTSGHTVESPVAPPTLFKSLIVVFWALG